MPNYSTTAAPFIIDSGDVVFAFNAESPAPPQSSIQFALPSFTGARADQSRQISWQTSFASAPTAVNVVLQAADQDADASYATVDTSTNVNGERRQILVRARFVRARLVSQTGGGAVTLTLAA
ncbi:MAG TPA: hypothetical protein VLW54_12035 [Candidatus Acidoferrales bacterium]|nr:hypothetical protein [Candidatus Acidoferrales bacterium]